MCGGDAGRRAGGRHVFGNLYDVDVAVASDEIAMRRAVEDAARAGGMEILELRSWAFGGRKGGVSVIAILRESHIAVHTWIEYRYATVDVYTGSEKADPWRAFEHLTKVLKPRYYTVSYADRSSLSLVKSP